MIANINFRKLARVIISWLFMSPVSAAEIFYLETFDKQINNPELTDRMKKEAEIAEY